MDVIADTSVVIALEREARRGVGPAHAFLKEHAEDRFYITFTVSGELACGESAAAESAWQELIAPYALLGWRPNVSLQYGRIYRSLKTRGELIGTNDLWIAATALSYAMPIATRNASEFARVDGLQVLSS